jgi:hypothetical protein
MVEDAVVAPAGLVLWPDFVAPFIFKVEVIIGMFGLGGQRAPDAAIDADCGGSFNLLNGENWGCIFVQANRFANCGVSAVHPLGWAEEHVPSCKIATVEQCDWRSPLRQPRQHKLRRAKRRIARWPVHIWQRCSELA